MKGRPWGLPFFVEDLLKLRAFLDGFLWGRITQGALPVYDDVRGSQRIFINPYYTRRCVMLKRKALMESISSNLHGFLKNIGNNLPVPSKKFLRDGVIGLLRCGKPVVCQMARHLPDQHR